MNDDLKLLDAYSQRVTQVVEQVGPAVVSIRSRTMSRRGVQEGAGSGVVIAPDGYVLTNSHVISGAGEIDVSMADGHDYEAKVVGEDPTATWRWSRWPPRAFPRRSWGTPTS